MPSFTFHREFRTATSEQYTIYRGEAEVGIVDLHIREDRTRVLVVITGPLPEGAEDDLTEALEDELLESTAPEGLAPEVDVELFRGERLAVFTDAPAPHTDDDD